MDPIHRELLRQAVEAAKDGDIEAALDLINEVLEDDEENVQAWLLMARLTRNIDQKRVALKNVMTLDPENERARQLLDRLEAQVQEKTEHQPEVIPGVSRRMAMLLGGGLVGIILVVLIILISINAQSASEEREREAEQRAALQTQTRVVVLQTNVLETATQRGLDLTATELAINTATPTPRPTSQAPTLPATATSTPTVTPTPSPVPPPADLTGQIIGWQGRGSYEDDLSLVQFALDGSGIEPVPVRDGRYPVLFPDGRIALTFYNRDAFSDEIEIVDQQGAPIPTNLDRSATILPYDNPRMPHVSRDGRYLVFVANPNFQSNRSAVYLIDLLAAPEQSIIRLTDDDAQYYFPSLSSDGRRVVVVRDPIESDNPGPDLVIIDVNSRTFSSLTSDRTAIAETMPRWSINDDLIFYAGVAEPPTDQAGRPVHNIYIINPLQPDTGRIRLESEADDLFPVPGPTGRYLAFSSDRTGNFNVFILDLTTSEVFQLSVSTTDSYAGDWRTITP
ncbi:MAG: hypothetical protein ACOCYT_02360 [Chloroflexota bacterium]